MAECLRSLHHGIELCFRVWARYARTLRARAKKVFLFINELPPERARCDADLILGCHAESLCGCKPLRKLLIQFLLLSDCGTAGHKENCGFFKAISEQRLLLQSLEHLFLSYIASQLDFSLLGSRKRHSSFFRPSFPGKKLLRLQNFALCVLPCNVRLLWNFFLFAFGFACLFLLFALVCVPPRTFVTSFSLLASFFGREGASVSIQFFALSNGCRAFVWFSPCCVWKMVASLLVFYFFSSFLNPPLRLFLLSVACGSLQFVFIAFNPLIPLLGFCFLICRIPDLRFASHLALCVRLSGRGRKQAPEVPKKNAVERISASMLRTTTKRWLEGFSECRLKCRVVAASRRGQDVVHFNAVTFTILTT